MSYKPTTMIFAYGDERYKVKCCNTDAAKRNIIEEQLYILWELTPKDNAWWTQLHNEGSCVYTYHGTEMFNVTFADNVYAHKIVTVTHLYSI